MSTGSPAIDYKLMVKTKDAKWTKLAKRVINGVMDYAVQVNKSDGSPNFRAIKIGEWEERDSFPGFYIIFPQFDTQAQAQYHRRDQIFSFECTITAKGKNFKDSLGQLLEMFGDFVEACEEDKVMNTIPAAAVAEAYHLELMGLAIGQGSTQAARSSEYLYGTTLVVVKALLDARIR